jgi:hypothetical protein
MGVAPLVSRARLTRDVAVGQNGSAGIARAGTVVRTLFHAPIYEGISPIPPEVGTIRLGMTDTGFYVILTKDNCEAVED